VTVQTEIRKARWNRGANRPSRLPAWPGLGREKDCRGSLIASTPNNVHRQAQRFGLAFRAAAAAIALPPAAGGCELTTPRRRNAPHARIHDSTAAPFVVATDPASSTISSTTELDHGGGLEINALEQSYCSERGVACLRNGSRSMSGKRLVKAFITLDRLPRLRGPRERVGIGRATPSNGADQLAQAELDESERACASRPAIEPQSGRRRRRIAQWNGLRPGYGNCARGSSAWLWLRASGRCAWRAADRQGALRREKMGAAHILSKASEGANFGELGSTPAAFRIMVYDLGL